ncbi:MULTISPECIES: hypothetical protein [Fusobacterium]|jgi:hypothetical protein|uniref:hypothetical protein n=1 Tax=Fusobacterium TaxID=848 RepID=UPI000E88A625|nr:MULTISPECIES: hypothetical protein [Fusobacterium]DAE77844.1 MAG TPA: hypothetical protein [Caudoviricetes sp.]HBJ79723.1 hypothetical protein [Fusobacterium sp.]
MKDFYIDSYGNFNFEIAENNKALRSALAVFLDIRSSNGYDDGELEYDENQGINFEFLLSNDISESDKTLYLSKKIRLYFTDIKELKNFTFESDKEKRNFKITFEYKTIYDGDYEKMEVITDV